ncbi:YkgJ family cysteine cluster protein [Blastopirellula marina]|nr:YkgJ family cysteine cluster protein [Blastopirellula marina]
MSPSSSAISSVFHQASREARGLVEQLVRKKGESLDWVDDLRQLQEHFMDKSPQKAQRDCRSGCSACCMTVQVDITPIEAIAVRDYMKSYLDQEALQKVEQRLVHVTKRRIAQIRAQAPATPLACAMLGMDGRCQIYPARPVICSGVFSLDHYSCDEARENAQGGDYSPTVPLDNDALQATGGISGTLQRVLVEKGLDGNLYELNSAVLVALRTPNVLARYLAKEDLFRSAICTDAHSPPRKRNAPPPKFLRRQSNRSA